MPWEDLPSTKFENSRANNKSPFLYAMPAKAASHPHNARWYETQALLEKCKTLFNFKDLIRLYVHDEAVLRAMRMTKGSARVLGIKTPVSAISTLNVTADYFDMIQQVKRVFTRAFNETVLEMLILPTYIVHKHIKRSLPELSKYHLPDSWASIKTDFWQTLGLQNQYAIAWLKDSIRHDDLFVPTKSLFEVLCAMGNNHAYIHYRLFDHIVDLEPAMLVALDLGLFAEHKDTVTLGKAILVMYGTPSFTNNALHYLKRLVVNFPSPELITPNIEKKLQDLARQSLLNQLTRAEVNALGNNIFALVSANTKP